MALSSQAKITEDTAIDYKVLPIAVAMKKWKASHPKYKPLISPIPKRTTLFLTNGATTYIVENTFPEGALGLAASMWAPWNCMGCQWSRTIFLSPTVKVLISLIAYKLFQLISYIKKRANKLLIILFIKRLFSLYKVNILKSNFTIIEIKVLNNFLIKKTMFIKFIILIEVLYYSIKSLLFKFKLYYYINNSLTFIVFKPYFNLIISKAEFKYYRLSPFLYYLLLLYYYRSFLKGIEVANKAVISFIILKSSLLSWLFNTLKRF
ncbi:hypothetical protein B0T21DRAFT_351135 [Apiosordaria backusii]|uniref:Uncharacterized protein n=1 Tax=Apiosordaria backusii TaxID=314023 RepID=A0AA40AXX4_9PEZI|nr:hypothetical protein B0T21DRAFT_351135 [Apiosordaria backusii]